MTNGTARAVAQLTVDELVVTPADGSVCVAAWIDGQRATKFLTPSRALEIATALIFAAASARESTGAACSTVDLIAQQKVARNPTHKEQAQWRQ